MAKKIADVVHEPSPEEIAEARIAVAKRRGARKLGLAQLGLTKLPSTIGELEKLQILDLSGNRFQALPEFICDLPHLSHLVISDNDLNHLPDRIGELENLQYLDAGTNKLHLLPETIGDLTRLSVLVLEDNELHSLPKGLLRLAERRILSALFLHGNVELAIPLEMLGPKWAKIANRTVSQWAAPLPPIGILRYYFGGHSRSRNTGSRPLNEAKVLVLGEAEVGKSSLILALTEGRLKQPLSKTHGILQKEWKVPVRDGQLTADEKAAGAETLRLNLWDFGGQEVYHSTHTFFLTHRAVYLLVADARANDRQNNLEYWLQMAVSFGAGAPIWVAVNKCDAHGDGPDEHALKRKFAPALRGFLRTSCWDGAGIEELKRTLVAEALKLDGVRQPMNNIWLGIKTALEETKEDTIPLESYLQLCREKGEDDSAMQTQLLDLWDKLGTVRYFPTRPDDPPEMRDTAILNPEWVTKAVYAVLDDAAIREREGLILDSDMERILCACGYPPGRHRMIEQVMRRFDLLYDTPDHDPHKMLVPQLLPEHQPKIDWPAAGTLRFLYRYPVLPAALVPTVIARVHRNLSRTPGPWRHGCVLEFKDCRALVIGDAEAKQVEISVAGQPIACRDALDAVRFTFEGIHGAIKDLAVEELIPVPGRPDAPLLKYRHLRSLEFSEIATLPAEGAEPGEIIPVDVREALNGVRGKQKEKAEAAQIINFNAPGARAEFMEHKTTNTQNITGGTFNAPVGINQAFSNCYNTAQAAPQPDVQQALKALIAEVEKIHPQLSEGERGKAEKRLKTLTEAAAQPEPDKEQIAFSGNGLIEAAKTCAEMAPSVVGAVKTVLGLFGVA